MLSGLTKNQFNRMIAMLSMGYSPRTAYTHLNNLNREILLNIRRALVRGVPKNRALHNALNPHEPNYRRRGESAPSFVRSHALNQAHRLLSQGISRRKSHVAIR